MGYHKRLLDIDLIKLAAASSSHELFEKYMTAADAYSFMDTESSILWDKYSNGNAKNRLKIYNTIKLM
jgi:hypothetical protein